MEVFFARVVVAARRVRTARIATLRAKRARLPDAKFGSETRDRLVFHAETLHVILFWL